MHCVLQWQKPRTIRIWDCSCISQVPTRLKSNSLNVTASLYPQSQAALDIVMRALHSLLESTDLKKTPSPNVQSLWTLDITYQCHGGTAIHWAGNAFQTSTSESGVHSMIFMIKIIRRMRRCLRKSNETSNMHGTATLIHAEVTSRTGWLKWSIRMCLQ